MPQFLQAELSCSLCGHRHHPGPCLWPRWENFGSRNLPGHPPPLSPGLVLIFSHLSTFSACSPVSWQAVNQSQPCVAGPCSASAAEEDTALEGWGGIISAAKETTLACALCWPCCALCYTSLLRHSCCVEDFSCSTTSLLRAQSLPCDARGWTRSALCPWSAQK